MAEPSVGCIVGADQRGDGVPVTLKLSKKFYETFGEQVTNELVDAFNQVDATYRSDLREMNESNFARSDAKQEARFAQMEAKIETRFAQFEQRWAEFEARFEVRFAQFQEQNQRQFHEIYRFMLLGWATVLTAIVAATITSIFALR